MENWKRALIAGSVGAGLLLLWKGRKPAGLLCTGIGLAALASEYPEEFRQIRQNFNQYVEQGATLLEVSSRIGERLGQGHHSSLRRRLAD